MTRDLKAPPLGDLSCSCRQAAPDLQYTLTLYSHVTMTLQWAAVAAFLYGQIAVNLMLCFPFISAQRY
ncbi:hypothetical protein CRUP_022165 [Coryphaenoides rupestris]|nr:hypothetical protein CRUP_022165 [Coryphaenoides rupestris]